MSLYKQYDQASLDAQYNTRLQVPEYAYHLTRWESLSRQTEQRLTGVKDSSYGELPGEKLDIYPSAQPGSKTFVFLHGGYWQMLDKSMFQFMADAFHSYSVTTVVLNYPLAPEASFDQIVMSCRNAIKWLYHHLAEFNGDPDQIYLTGHSAGGHLAAMMMATDWPRFEGSLPANLISGVCTISGLFNLEPIYFSYVNKVIQMDIDTAKCNSPVRLEPFTNCPLIIAVGEAESEEFIDQSNEFYTCWKEKGIDSQAFQLSAQNHYSILETITDSQTTLHKALLNLMQIHRVDNS